MTKLIFAALLMIPLIPLIPFSSVSAETMTLQCDPVPLLNGATIDGTVSLTSRDDGSVAGSGTLNLVLQRQGRNYAPISLPGVQFAGTVIAMDGLPSPDGSTPLLRVIKVRGVDTTSEDIQFMSLSLDLQTRNANSWVRTYNGAKYFARCSLGPAD